MLLIPSLGPEFLAVPNVEGKTEKRAKPSTLRSTRSLLAKPNGNPKQRGARIMRFFGGRELFGILTKDIRLFLACVARSVRRGEIRVHAYVVMTTHFHLLLESVKGAP